MGLEALSKVKEEYEAKIKAEGEAALKEGLKSFFEANPNIEAVRWTQYTPHFNDGDACVFGVHEPSAQLKGSEDFQDEYDIRKEHPAEAKALSELEGLLESAEDVLETVLGDHSRITVTGDKVDIEEYEHD
jgi:hypothetical protein